MNPHDAKSRDEGLFVEGNLPTVLANDVAGEIVKLGPLGTGDFHVGDHVFSRSDLLKNKDHGGLQQYCLLDPNFSSKVPPNVTDRRVATVACNLMAPFISFFDVLAIPLPGTEESKSFGYKAQIILIIGGGANCGKLGVQLAKWAGFGRIIVVAGKRNEGELKKCGATHIIDRHVDDVLSEIREIAGDDLMYAYDAINEGEAVTLGVAALSNTKKGALATPLSGRPDSSKIGKKEQGFHIKQTFGLSWVHPELAKFFWSNIYGWLESGVITPLCFKVLNGLDADKVNAIYDNYAQGRSQSKVHVLPD